MKMYNMTYFPLLVSAYGLLSMPIIVFGRLGQGDILYMTSSRYCCETTLVWVGCGFVYSIALLWQAKRWVKCTIALPLGVVCALLVWADATEWYIAPARGAYKDFAIEMLLSDSFEDFSDEELAIFQSQPTTVRVGVKQLKEYHLNVFHIPADEVPGTTLETAKKKNKIGLDGWVEPGASLQIATDDSGRILIDLYDPYWDKHKDGTCTVYVNDVEYLLVSPAKNQRVELELKPDQIYDIRFESDYFVEETQGERKLLFILVDVTGAVES